MLQLWLVEMLMVWTERRIVIARPGATLLTPAVTLGHGRCA
jgi:hypothetical protein